MTVTLDLGSELETELRDEAAKQGVDPNGFILDTLRDRLRRDRRDAPSFSGAEADLLLKINVGLPEETWRRYHALVARRRAETLNSEEHTELIRLTGQVEQDNARRVGHLIELARLRHTTLEAIMQSLGINPKPYV